jgi:hypothetical protein
MREVFRNEYYRAELDEALHLIRVTRTAARQTASDVEAAIDTVIQAVGSMRPVYVLLDMRLAPGNSDPALEQKALTSLRRLSVLVGEIAVLVASAVGRLHFQRMSRSGGPSMQVFLDEFEALRFLGEKARF